jgi:cytochrome c biogenesis factor
MINYVWLAAFLMALGGIIAACDRRYRVPVAARDAVPDSGAALPGRAG